MQTSNDHCFSLCFNRASAILPLLFWPIKWTQGLVCFHNKYWDMVGSSVCRDSAPQGQGPRGLKAHLIGGVSEQGHGEQTPEPISTVFVSHAKEVVRNTLSPSLMSYFRTRTNSLQGWILLSENLLKSVHVPSDTDWRRWTVVLHPT